MSARTYSGTVTYSNTYPHIRKSVRFLEAEGQFYFLDAYSELRFSVDENLFHYAQCLDGSTDPFSISLIFPIDTHSAFQQLRKWDLIEYPGQTNARYPKYRRRRNQQFLKRFLRHPNFICLILVGLMGYAWLSRQGITFLLSTILLCFILIGGAIMDVKNIQLDDYTSGTEI